MHRGYHGSLDPIDGHLRERVLGNVCRVLESSGNTLKGLDARDGFGIIRKQCVIFMREGKISTKSEIVSMESEIVSVKSGIVSVESGMVLTESKSVSE
jgi:hypothetical protein